MRSIGSTSRKMPDEYRHILRHRWNMGCVAVAAALVWGGSALATENGAQEYPIGIETAASALFPPVGGTQFYNYNVYFQSSRLNDGNGNKLIPDFNLDVFASAVRFIHSYAELGPFTVSAGIVQPFVNIDLKVAPGVNFHSFGAADTVLQPVYLSTMAAPATFVSFGLSIDVPDGEFSRNNPASPGFNRYTFAPELALTYFPCEGCEFNVHSIFEFSQKNPADNFQSGDEVTVEVTGGYSPFPSLPNLELEVTSFVFKQFTDDSQNGITLPGGNQGQAFAIGPQIRYNIEHGGFLGKFQHEFAVENRPQGDQFIFQFALPL